MNNPLAFGVDLGATKTAIALVGLDGVVRASRVMSTLPIQGFEAVIARIAGEINALSAQTHEEISGIGVGAAAIVDPQRGVVTYSKNLDWRQVPLIDEFRQHLSLQVPLWLQTDTFAEAIGEWYFGAARGCRDFVYIAIGSGLGGAVFSNGQLVTGLNNMAGFIGMYSLDPNGRPDSSGIPGCTESVLSARGLVAIANEIHVSGKYPTRLTVDAILSTEAVLDAAREGDPLALASLARLGAYLGEVITPCVAILNPARIVIGGGLGLAAFDWIVPAAKRELERRAYIETYRDLKIVPYRSTDRAIGAACLVFNALNLF